MAQLAIEQRPISRIPSVLRHEKLKSHPTELDSELCNDTNVVCRICWGEEGAEMMISPCNCDGTQRFVHRECLHRWMLIQMERKGPAAAYQCDICRSRLSLPKDMHLNIPRLVLLRRSANASWERLQHSPAGPILSAFLTTSWIYSGVYSIYGVISQAAEMPRLLAAARHSNNPFSVLRPLLGRLAMAIILEPLFSTQDFLFHLETILFYSAGWLLDHVATAVDLTLVQALPLPLMPIAHTLLYVPKSIGLAFQILDLAVMSVFGGAAAGFVQGALICMSMPFKLMSLAARCGSGLLGCIAVGLSHGARGVGLAAGALTLGRGRIL